MLSDLDLLVLDKDGVLLDFHALWGAVARSRIDALCERTGRPELRPALALALGLDGMGRAEPHGVLCVGTRADSLRAAQATLHAAGVADAEAIATACYDAADGAVDRHALSRPLPGAIEAVREFAAMGLKLAIATTDSTPAARAFLEAQGVAGHFCSLVGADRVGAHKPAPEAFWLACAEAGVEPARAAMIGDAPVDVAMGRAAGAALTIGLLSGVGKPADLVGADRLLPSLAALASSRAESGYT